MPGLRMHAYTGSNEPVARKDAHERAFPGIPEAAQTLIVALVAAVVMLASFLAASISCKDALRKGGEKRLRESSRHRGISPWPSWPHSA